MLIEDIGRVKMIKESILKKASEYTQEYITKYYEQDKKYFGEIIKAGKMVYVVKKRTPAATHFDVNYIINDTIHSFPPAYLEILGGFNKDTQHIRVAANGINRTLSLHAKICRLFAMDYMVYNNYTEL